MKAKKIKLFCIIMLAIIFAGVIFMLINNYCISTTYSVNKNKNIQNNVRLVLLSDLHGKSFGKGNKNLVKAVLAQKPDIILLAGDMYDEKCDTEAVNSLISGMREGCRHIYYSFGNHESNHEDKREIMEKTAKNAGAVVLNNAVETIEIKGNTLHIYGIEIPMYYYSGYIRGTDELMYSLTGEKIEELIGKSTDETDILIAHNPIHLPGYAEWGADIVVSGHNHGGTVRLPFYGAVASPNGDRGNIHYDCGEYKIGDCTMYLSRGLGEWLGPVRVFNLPELYVIDLVG